MNIFATPPHRHPANDNEPPSARFTPARRTVIAHNGIDIAILAAAAPAIPSCSTALTNTGTIEDALDNFEVAPAARRSLLSLDPLFSFNSRARWRVLVPRPAIAWHLQDEVRHAIQSAAKVAITTVRASFPDAMRAAAMLGLVPLLVAPGVSLAGAGPEYLTSAFTANLADLAHAATNDAI